MIRHAVLVGEVVEVPLTYGLGKSEGEENSKCLHILHSPISSELKYCYKSPFFYLKKGGKSICLIKVSRTFNL